MENDDRLDPVHASDRIKGSTPPEPGVAGSNVVGRPADEPLERAVHERTETPPRERTAFASDEALDSGGSFDGLGVPVVETKVEWKPST